MIGIHHNSFCLINKHTFTLSLCVLSVCDVYWLRSLTTIYYTFFFRLRSLPLFILRTLFLVLVKRINSIAHKSIVIHTLNCHYVFLLCSFSYRTLWIWCVRFYHSQNIRVLVPVCYSPFPFGWQIEMAQQMTYVRLAETIDEMLNCFRCGVCDTHVFPIFFSR